MNNGTYLITGATGFIGHMLAENLLKSGAQVRLILPVRCINKAMAMYKDSRLECIRFIENTLEEPLSIDEHIDYIIHCASVTTSAEMVAKPVEVADGIVLGTRNILELARRTGVKSMVYLSSMEMYGVVQDIGRARTEDELGDISLSSARSCYSLGKRMAEHYCHIYKQEYGVPVKIARLAQVFGKGVRADDNRVYMQFARAARDGRDIVLKTAGNSMGNYCATEDAVAAIFTILDKGIDGEVYNVVNEANTMSIRSMAELVAGEIVQGRIKVQIDVEDIAKTGYAPDTGLRLSSEKLRQLGWKPSKNLAEMYKDIMTGFRS